MRCKLLTRSPPFRLFRKLKSEEKYRDLLVGIDISGDPRISNLAEVLDKITKLRNNDGMKFAIHLAEVPNHEETSAVLATNPDRIGVDNSARNLLLTLSYSGHGTCIHPSLGGSENLWQQLTQVKCPVEVCLSSNVICQTVPTYQHHHAGLYIKHGVPIGEIYPRKS